MTRYVSAKPGYIETPLWDDDRKSLRPSLSVSGPKRTDTGLVDKDGNPIMRIAPPIGFGRDGEWK